MILTKITYGFVLQTYDTKAKRFTKQAFVAGDQVEWERADNGGPVEDQPKDYLPFEMVQPTRKRRR